MHYNVSVPEQALNWEEFMYMYSVHVDWRLVVEAEPCGIVQWNYTFVQHVVIHF